jgi:hypothetical protein
MNLGKIENSTFLGNSKNFLVLAATHMNEFNQYLDGLSRDSQS